MRGNAQRTKSLARRLHSTPERTDAPSAENSSASVSETQGGAATKDDHTVWQLKMTETRVVAAFH